MQSYQIPIIFKPIAMQFEIKLRSLIDKVNKNNDDAFHSLNMNINYISDKLSRLNCDTQHLTNLCVDKEIILRHGVVRNVMMDEILNVEGAIKW